MIHPAAIPISVVSPAVTPAHHHAGSLSPSGAMSTGSPPEGRPMFPHAMRMFVSVIACAVMLSAAEPATRPGGPGRLLMTYEVEVITVKPDEAASVAVWTELAALGYHVVAMAPKPDGSSVLYLERMGAPGTLQVPTILNQDPTSVESLRARVQERRQGLPGGQVPTATPAPAPAPSTK